MIDTSQNGIELNHLLATQAIDPEKVLVMRHRPFEAELQKVLPWLAAERPDVFNAYQQTQGERVENAMDPVDRRLVVSKRIREEFENGRD